MADAKTNPRELALDILTEVLEEGKFKHLVLGAALDKYQYLEKQDRAFITRLVDGTIEYCLQIDGVLNRFSSVKVSRMKPLIRTLLRMSVYQILYMDRIPDAACCNEAVKLAGKRHFQGLKSYVNGVLRTISREKGKLTFSGLSENYSMPQWIVDHFLAYCGKSATEEILKAFLHPSRLAVRLHTDLADREEILALLAADGVSVTFPEGLADLVWLEQVDHLTALKAFQKGYLQVQDLSSYLAGLAAAPEKGAFCVDVCGAPGGKSLHLAGMLAGSGHVLVRDLSAEKVALIESNISRSGYSNIEAQVWDALEEDPALIGKADLVVADLPCSGLGVIGRKPDIKYRLKPEDLSSLALLQRQILSVVSRYVKPGGHLLYSTCTIDPSENEENRTWFLANHPFRPLSLIGRIPESLAGPSAGEGYQQFLPGIDPCDGFFISMYEKLS